MLILVSIYYIFCHLRKTVTICAHIYDLIHTDWLFSSSVKFIALNKTISLIFHHCLKKYIQSWRASQTRHVRVTVITNMDVYITCHGKYFKPTHICYVPCKTFFQTFFKIIWKLPYSTSKKLSSFDITIMASQ